MTLGSGKVGAVELAVTFERDVTLTDGTVLHMRPVQRGDREGLALLHDEGLSDTSSYYRFFGLRPHLTAAFLDHMTEFDPSKRVSVVGVRDERIVAVGSYHLEREGVAEVAFAVADDHQGHGIGTLLLEDLALIAKTAGLTQLVAHTMAGNRSMMRVFSQVGLRSRHHLDSGIVDVEIDLADDAGLVARADARAWAAQAVSLRPYLAPRSVVVIGAGREPTTPGHRIAVNAKAEFRGDLAVVRPDGQAIAGVPGFASVADVPFPIDLAVIAVPAAATPAVLDDCGRAGVKATVVITAGFSESGIAGGTTDADLVAIAHRYGMRLLGPNCLGVIAPAVGLDATFSSVKAPVGRVAFGSQSGGLGIAVLAEAAQRGIGISSFVSLGNRADVSSNDLLCAWAEDESTRVILLYLESIGNARQFLRIARHVSAIKPVVILKAGRTAAGRRGAASHTAALASDDAAVDALFEAAGVMRVQTLQELLDVAQLLDDQPVPTGRRVALVGNAGGPLILAADASEVHGLLVPLLSTDLRERILTVVPTAAATANPVDLLATVTATELGDVVRIVADSGEVDAVVVASVALGARDGAAVTNAIALSPIRVPVAVSLSGTPDLPPGRSVYRYSERAVGAMALVARWGERQRRRSDEAAPSDDSVDWVAARRAIRGAAAAAGAGWLGPEDVARLLAAAEIPIAASAIARSSSEAADLAECLAGPAGDVVLKAVVPGLLHKTEAGGVVTGVVGRDAAVAVYEAFRSRFADLTGVVVQTQIPPGPELLVGARQDAVAGPLVVVAAGGIEAELLADRVLRTAPFSEAAARDLVLSLRTSARLTGFRGRPPSDVDAIARVVARVARLVTVVPEVLEFEINPLLTGPTGAFAVDARVRVDPDIDSVFPLRGT